VSPKRRTILGLALLSILGTASIIWWQSGSLEHILQKDALKITIEELGASGPILVIGLMTAAIVMSPLPSAPIALAAGAAYGHLWGTVYVATGSLSGALVAFGIARYIGSSFVEERLNRRAGTEMLDRFLKSQNALMATVFLSRLMPFLSFDIISYAAGLTPLAIWRFAVATVAGIVPTSFLLAHFGEELASADVRRIGLTVLLLGFLTAVPFVAKYLYPRVRKYFE
tara:strand:+ start:3838 stop:4518 length:681 start_codon:yes stop_codon:yes gene_type:complete